MMYYLAKHIQEQLLESKLLWVPLFFPTRILTDAPTFSVAVNTVNKWSHHLSDLECAMPLLSMPPLSLLGIPWNSLPLLGHLCILFTWCSFSVPHAVGKPLLFFLFLPAEAENPTTSLLSCEGVNILQSLLLHGEK